MRRLLAWISGAAGGVALYKLAARRRPPASELPAAGADPRAEELRAKLEEQEQPEPPAEVEDTADDVEARRARVHDAARAAVDEMRGTREAE